MYRCFLTDDIVPKERCADRQCTYFLKTMATNNLPEKQFRRPPGKVKNTAHFFWKFHAWIRFQGEFPLWPIACNPCISLLWASSKNSLNAGFLRVPFSRCSCSNKSFFPTRRTSFHVTENVEDIFFLDDRYQLFVLNDKYVRCHYAHPRNESFSQ